MNAPLLSEPAIAPTACRVLEIFLIAGEPSGDVLGANLMRALANRAGRIRFAGVGGSAMEAEGLASLLPLTAISVMGILPVLARLPQLLAAIRDTAHAVIAANPDVLVLIDSPDFTHRVARLVRRARPDLPIVNYVGPSVWAWRPGRARRMRRYIDHVLALLPFEPAAHQRLGGPDCTYVGHPVVRQSKALQPSQHELRMRETLPATLLVMPGSRQSEIRKLMPVFGAAAALVGQSMKELDLVLPTLAHLESVVRAEAEKWPMQPRIVVDTHAKHAAMRRARAALVASGTATLELALATVPMVVAYRVSLVEELVARLMIRIDYIALPNLILGRSAVPELLQRQCTAERLAGAVIPLLADGERRDAQVTALRQTASLMQIDREGSPSDKAAEIVERIALARA
jgi:lipid-A-disaccharide synthase